MSTSNTNITASEDYEEVMKLLEPLLYAIPSMSETIKEKYSEFGAKKKGGMQYNRDELVKVGLKSLGGLLGYVARESGQGGLIQRLIMKNAGEYVASVITEMIFGSKR